MSDLITSMCDDCKYVKYSFDGGSTKCGYRGKKDCNFILREKKDLAKYKVRNKKDARELFVDCTRQLEEAKAEIDRLKRGVTFTFTIEDFESIKETVISRLANKIKSEAIKEFAERLKEKFGIADCIVTVDSNYIDDLVKEMTEVQE